MCVCCQPVVWHSQNCLCKNNWVKSTILEYVIKTKMILIILIYTQDDVTLNVSNSKIIIYENKASYVDMKYDIAYKSNCTHQTDKLWSNFLSIDLWTGTKYFSSDDFDMWCIINEYTLMHKDRFSKDWDIW